MERNGWPTVADAVQALPGNFAGSATQQSALAFADNAGTNSTLATGVNLRGLGADATLVLINGRRVAGAGLMGNFTDISGIPTGAVERIEVLTDGASALYGSDAVGGVVNIVMKERFDGAETRMRLGSVTSGGAWQGQFDQTFGRSWTGGGVYLSYEYNRSAALASSSRSFARSADSRSLGGTDHRYYYSLPGNILSYDENAGAYVPTYAIPAGQDGTALTSSDFLAGQVNMQNFREDTDLTPDQRLHSVYAKLDQNIADGVDLSLDARYSNRRASARSLGSMTAFSVTEANPYFVSPTNSTSEIIAYSFAPELGPSRISSQAEALSVSGSLDVALGSDWLARAYGTFAQEIDRDRTSNLVHSYALNEALGNIPDDPATDYSPSVDGYFNPFGSGNSNSAATLAYIGGGYTSDYGRSRVLIANAQADGSLFSWAAGNAKLALGANLRKEMFARQAINLDSAATPTIGQYDAYSRVISAGFAELRLPLVGKDNALPGIATLDLSAAVRTEHYSDFGTTTNPSFGLRWSPLQGLTVRGTIGTSFRAPNLRQLNAASRVSTVLVSRVDGSQVVVIQRSGGNPDLKPERAKTWTAGADLQPAFLPGLSMSASVYRTIFDNRIDQPVVGDMANALSDPAYSEFVQLVSPATNASDLATVTSLLAQTSSSYAATSVGAIVDNRYKNTGRLDVSGIDLNTAYAFAVGPDHFDLGVNGSYLLRYRVRLTPTGNYIDRRNLAGYPAALRGRLTAGWRRGEVNLLAGMNYVGRYHDANGNRVNAWTTFDLQAGWAAQGGPQWRRGLSLSLSAQNLFDRDPPFYDAASGAGYDAANASALGRVLALQLSKRW